MLKEKFRMDINGEMLNRDLFHVWAYLHSSEGYIKATNDLVTAASESLKSFPQIWELFDMYKSTQILIININRRYVFLNGFKIGEQIVL